MELWEQISCCLITLRLCRKKSEWHFVFLVHLAVAQLLRTNQAHRF